MRELLAIALILGVIGVSMMIMSGIMAVSYTTIFATLPNTANSSLLNATQGYTAAAITIFLSLLGVVSLAAVGGLAIYYVMTYIGGSVSGKR